MSLSPFPINTGKRFIQAERLEAFVNSLRETCYLLQFTALILGLSLYSYHARELLVCWLFFIVLFVCLALIVLSGILAIYVGQYLTVWAHNATATTTAVVLGFSKLHLKYIWDARKLK
jgi:hypothetical protein